MRTRSWRSKRSLPLVNVVPEVAHANPYPIYRWLRENEPVALAPALDGFCLVTRWDDVETVLKDDETYSSRVDIVTMPESLVGNLLLTDGKQHARARASMQAPCRPRPANAFADSVVLADADELIDGFEADREAELVDSFFEPLATQVVAKLLGLEDVPLADLRRWFDHTARHFTWETLPPEAYLSNQEFDDAILERLRRLAVEPDSSLLSTMLHWQDDGGELGEQQLLANAKAFAAAGWHEFRDLVAHALLGLLSRPEQLAELRTDPSLAKGAIEEAARWGTPVGMVPRITTSPTRLAGVRLPAGARLAAVIASANRDEKRWTDGGRFDLHRDEGMHLAFASGAHFCLGAWLARAAGAIVLNRVIERLPELRLKPGEPPVVTGWRFRVMRRLYAVWR
jgi:cytochrome P450